jgi:hypothetical protein
VSVFEGRRGRPWQIPTGGRGSFTADASYLGKGRTPLEVAVARAAKSPNDGDVRNLWKRRKGNTPSPLLLIVLWPDAIGERASVCGPSGDEPPVYADRDPEQIFRVASLALDETDHHAARRVLDGYLPQDGGVRNHSLFASHHLFERIPLRADWNDLCLSSVELLPLRRQELVEALGFTVEPSGQATLLRADGQARAMALFLDDSENPEAVSTRFNGMTPVSWAIARATSDNIPYVIVTRGDQLRIHTAKRDAAQRTGAYVELNLPLLTTNDAGYLRLLFSAETLRDGGEFDRILAETKDFALGLGDRLRNRVYDKAVPAIASALIVRHEGSGGATDSESLSTLYNQTLLILFRLLFLAYAEDRGLLPLESNDLYRQQSLKGLARQIADMANQFGVDEVPFDDSATDYWDQVRALCTAIDRGRKEWNVPPYNGGLFSTDPEVNADGAALADVSLTNAEFGPCLLGLLVDLGEDGLGAIDFASLDVREFGTIYEGLLESDLAVAPCDLTLNRADVYVPAKASDHVWYYEGQVYLHNQSGARKAGGAYFTKPFAVQHLLAHALEPALDDHLARLTALVDAGDELGASDAFFDFRCVDLAMGSGHFLVAAVDHIERRLSEFLSEHRLGPVLEELDRLGEKSAANLAEVGLVADPPDTGVLLRRQIARRCIYGVDMNPTSVELARLALWIHTFVKGLPLTSLGHGLVVGNSLTGMGTLDEVLAVLDPGAALGIQTFVSTTLVSALIAAREALLRFAQIGEADRAEVKMARDAQREASEAAETARVLCDLAVAVRLGEASLPQAFNEEELLAAAGASGAAETAHALNVLHFPVAFPEVFQRDRPGFDCIVGNPPWEEATVEKLGFFALRFPGLKSLPQGEQSLEITRLELERPDLVTEYDQAVVDAKRLRQVLHCGQFPGMGTGDADLYKAFVWRFWNLLRPDGAVGVVLPRSALSAAGLAPWREKVLAEGTFSDVTMMLNQSGWAFDDAEHRYTIGLVSFRKGARHSGDLFLSGPFRSYERYVARGSAARIPTSEFLSWSEGASFPLIPSEEALGVFRKLHSQPRLDAPDDLRVRAATEFHATNDKRHMVLNPESTEGLWPIYGGRGFNLWEQDTGEYYAWARPEVVVPILEEKRRRAARQARSVFSEFPRGWASDPSTLPCFHPRIAFRDVSRATDTRTMIAALIPPNVVLTNSAPYLLLPGSTPSDEAYVLGVIASIPFDWAARRVVETHVNLHILNSLPMPRPRTDHPLRVRIAEIAATLAAVDDRYAKWATAAGVPVGGVPANDRGELLAELDAAVALLCGLSAADVEVVFSTFHEGWDFGPRLAEVLEHFGRLKELMT